MSGIKWGQQLELEVRLGFPHSNQPGFEPSAHLEITDVLSRSHICDIELSPTQLMSLLGGSGAYVTASVSRRLDRVGKKHQNGSKILGKTYEMSQDEANAAAGAWAQAEGWESVEVRRNNESQWTVVGRRWVTPTTDEEKQA